MAFVAKTNLPEPLFVNVGASVGRNCLNTSDDVRVVQTMLKDVLASDQWQARIRNRQVTGNMDDVTYAMILLFQGLVKDIKGGSIVVDGRVDPAQDFVGPLHHEVYTIIQLNTAFKAVSPLKFKQMTGSL